MASLLRNLPDSHPFLSAAERREAASTQQKFKAVGGLGKRRDVVAVIQHFSPFWVRSFEGSDPETTVYLVYGPDCDATWEDPKDPVRAKCHPVGDYLRAFRLYRVRGSGLPEDVAHELAPAAPTLSPSERRRYGPYLRAEGDARNADVRLDISRLAYAPALRWVLRPVQEGDYTPPDIPAWDPRAFMDFDRRGRAAHFGFLVWTGTRFGLRERLPETLWPCRSVRTDDHVCAAGYEGRGDRYLDHGGSAPRAGEAP